MMKVARINFVMDAVSALSRIVGGWAIVGLIGLLAMTLSLGCGGDDKGTNGGDETNQIADDLVFTRDGGAPLNMGIDWSICCAVWEAGQIDEMTFKILFYDSDNQMAGWKLFLMADSIIDGTTYRFPTAAAGQGPVAMFINDIASANELNSDQANSSGSIKVVAFSCGPPTVISFVLDATIASEAAGSPPVHVTGTFSCVIYTNPSPLGCDFSF